MCLIRYPKGCPISAQQTADAIGVRIAGDSCNDRVLVATGGGAGKPQTVSGKGESFTFTDFGWIRVTAEQVEMSGNVTAMKLNVAGKPKLVVNGQAVPSAVSDGVLAYETK